MRKLLLSFIVILVAAFAVTGCATMGGSYVGAKPYPGPLGDVVAGNLGLTCPGDVFIGPPINRCLRHISGGIGRYVGLGYPMYWGSPSGLRLSDADKVALLCGLGTGAVATLSGGTIRTILSSGVLGYVACRAIGMVSSRSHGGSQEEVVVDPDQIPQPPTPSSGSPMPSQQQAPNRENGWNQRLRQQAGTYQRGQIEGRPVNNRTGLDILLWIGDSTDPLFIPKGGSDKVPRNPSGLEAETLETAPGGNEIRRPAIVVPNRDRDGWDIVTK